MSRILGTYSQRICSSLVVLSMALYEGWGFCRLVAQDSLLPPGDESPILRLEPGGPRSFISALAFGPEGKQLYATGWDKVVHVWNVTPQGQFEFSPGSALRVPAGPELYGALNAMTLSSDGEWLAVAGQSVMRGMAGQKEQGWVSPTASLFGLEAQLDEGLIYVFNTQSRETLLLRGHRGPVQTLAFVDESHSSPPELVSVAQERTNTPNQFLPRLRFWDVGKTQELASLSQVPSRVKNGKPSDRTMGDLPSLNGFRPGIAAWSFGKNPRQARVALAWGDDHFRIWDVESGKVASESLVAGRNYCLSVVPLSSSYQQLLTGAYQQVGVWSIGQKSIGTLEELNERQFQLGDYRSVNGQDGNLPGRAAFIPSGDGQEAMVAMVVTRYANGQSADHYRLVLGSAVNPSKMLVELKLPWKSGEIRTPSIAASSDGKRLAISGNERNEIELYNVSELLKGKQEPQTILKSIGLAFQKATFVRMGEGDNARLGIRLRQNADFVTRNENVSEAVFDVRNRKIELLASDDSTWKPAAATMPGWSLSREQGKAIVQRSGGLGKLELQIDSDQELTSAAFCEANKHCPIPLIGVGTHRLGRPQLQIFRGDNGQPVRFCSGHTERIRSVSFSDDGRMMVSTSDDRTVAVWSLTDLVKRTIDQRGRIPDLELTLKTDKLVVSAASKDRLLQVGDEINGVVKNGKLTKFDSAKAFYLDVRMYRPREFVEVSLKRNGTDLTVKVPLWQAVDEVKPLFNLFVAPGERPNEWSWIGWHPLGNFDSTSETVERWLGWHFNTGEPNHPARYAAIGEYRDGFYRRDLIQLLIDQQSLVVPKVEENPKVSMWLRYQDGTPVRMDYEDRPQIERGNVELVAEVTGIAHGRIRGLEASIDDGTPISLSNGDAKEWTADLSSQKWNRGLHRLTLSLKTPDRDINQTERIQYRPAPPTIEWNPSFKGELQTEQVPINAKVVGTAGPVNVQLRVQKAGAEEFAVVRSWESAEEVDVDETVAVEPGENQIEILAWNAESNEEDRQTETSRIAGFARRATPPKAPSLEVTSIGSMAESGEPQDLVAEANKYRSLWPRIRIKGTIASSGPLSNATIQVGTEARALTSFEANRDSKFSIDETLSLEPGSHSIVLRSTSEDLSTEKRFTIVYEPPLPSIDAMTISSKAIRTFPEGFKVEPLTFYSGFHEATVKVDATIAGRLDQTNRTILSVNDTPLSEDQIQIDHRSETEHRISATIPVEGGQSVVSLRIDNDWNRQPVSRTLEFDYRRPPEILTFLAEDKLVGKPLGILCRIRSRLPLRKVRLIVDGIDDTGSHSLKLEEGSSTDWLLTASNIGLSEGSHEIRIVPINDDGESLESVVHKVSMQQPRIEPPLLTIVSPASADSGQTVNSTALPVQFQVRSSVPTEVRISILGNGDKQEIRETTIVPGNVPTDESITTEQIELFSGVNEIEMIARNAGGTSRQVFKISCIPSAVVVKIESVDGIVPDIHSDGSGRFAKPASKALVKLKGQIITRNKAFAGGQFAARVWVNRFKLPNVPIVFSEADSTVGRFETDVVFNRSHGNSIRVDVFRSEGKLASELGCTDNLLIDCLTPDKDQDLYLLILGSGQAREYRENAQRILEATPISDEHGLTEVWESKSFSRIYVDNAVNATPAAVQNRLRELVVRMMKNLKTRSDKGTKSAAQSIVMVYYSGKITLLDDLKDDFVFGAVEPGSFRKRGITGKMLEEHLTRSYGAHLVFLDLQQQSIREAANIWPQAPHLGIYVQNRKAPGDPMLISFMEQEMPRSRQVSDLSKRLRDRAAIFPDQLETVDLAKGIGDVPIGRAAD